MNELQRQRRMQRQPQLSAGLYQIVNWLHDLLKKKGRKTVPESVRAIHNRKNTWFDVLFQMWPLCANRNSVVEALVCSRPLMFYCVITRPTHIPDAISKEDVKKYADVVTYGAAGNYVPLTSEDYVASWARAAPFFDKTWKDVGVSTTTVYHIAGQIKVGVLVMHDDTLVGKHWHEDNPEPTRWVGYNVWGHHGFSTRLQLQNTCVACRFAPKARRYSRSAW